MAVFRNREDFVSSAPQPDDLSYLLRDSNEDRHPNIQDSFLPRDALMQDQNLNLEFDFLDPRQQQAQRQFTSTQGPKMSDSRTFDPLSLEQALNTPQARGLPNDRPESSRQSPSNLSTSVSPTDAAIPGLKAKREEARQIPRLEMQSNWNVDSSKHEGPELSRGSPAGVVGRNFKIPSLPWPSQSPPAPRMNTVKMGSLPVPKLKAEPTFSKMKEENLLSTTSDNSLVLDGRAQKTAVPVKSEKKASEPAKKKSAMLSNLRRENSGVVREKLAEERKRRFEAMLANDQKVALNSDYNTPFRGDDDVWKRLLPYHVFLTPNPKEITDEAWNEKVAKLSNRYEKRFEELQEQLSQSLSEWMKPVQTNCGQRPKVLTGCESHLHRRILSNAWSARQQRLAEQARAEQARIEQARIEQARIEQARAEQARAEQAKAEEARIEEPRIEEPRAEEPRTEEPRTEEAKEAHVLMETASNSTSGTANASASETENAAASDSDKDESERDDEELDGDEERDDEERDDEERDDDEQEHEQSEFSRREWLTSNFPTEFPSFADDAEMSSQEPDESSHTQGQEDSFQ
eukprot:CAMPEP_0198737550 /NCGR_PEP_ID=MMETSP1475-20131203/67923_1 /TAXON_ID= ORGANISM="Unidentified sp., Strain CCMP1999" /NCGR_SAMPLE_ID=MMETSP1475 /ASSEMBLY_ACC=CAM_ASM_001111 /LENGTH=574 /DNA_ID=CAMNT_0044501417 /DNA_START=545 /DNA_END=2269 /DNA_ORIENTATION=-